MEVSHQTSIKQHVALQVPAINMVHGYNKRI